MSIYDFDVITIGAGSGGVAFSRRAASHKAKVAICEQYKIGGTCVIRGCVPKKLIMYAASFAEEFVDSKGYGWNVENPKLDWSYFLEEKEKEINRLNQIYTRLLKDSGVSIFMGETKFLDSHTVLVGDKKITAESIVIATGGTSSIPDIPGNQYAINSDSALLIEQLPSNITIIGGGYIGVEFASFFNALGSKVNLVVRSETVLRGFDSDIGTTLNNELSKRGINLFTETIVKSIDKDSKGKLSLLTNSDEIIETDVVILATGRKPNISQLGIENVGIKLNDQCAIFVDEWSRTTCPNIYAIGDVTNRYNLTPVAINEGRVLADLLYKNVQRIIDYKTIPTAVFSFPPVGSVGYTEQEARNKFHNIDIYTSNFRPMKHILSKRDQRTHMKLVVDRTSDRVLGCHMVGTDAPEIIQGFAVAVNCWATKSQFDMTLGVHPSSAEEFVTMREKMPKFEKI